MKRIALAIALALTLAACDGGGSYSSNSSGEDGAEMLLLGGTAFMNGWNAGRDAPLPMTNYGGRTTIWSGQSGMLQGY